MPACLGRFSRPRIETGLTESVLLALMGGMAGTLLAWWSVKTLVLLLHFGPVMKVAPDAAVLLFTLAISIATGSLFGIVPAWRFSRLDLRPNGTANTGWQTRGLGNTRILIAVQVALSLCLLVGAGLLTRSLVSLEEQNLGFTRDHILLIRTDAHLAGYQPSQYTDLYQKISQRMGQLPGVQSAAITRFSPVSGYNSSWNFSIEGYQPPAGKDMRVRDLAVGPGLFEALKIPLLLGRTVEPTDTAASAPVVVVNQTFVNTYLRGKNPLGQHIEHGSPFKAPGTEIIGVVGDSRFFDVHELPKPMAFLPISQATVPGFEILLRTAANPNSVADEVRTALKQINNRLPILRQQTLDDQIQDSLEEQKLITSLCSIFGLLAAVLASIGIYGTLSYSASARTTEIGTRMALGAQKSQVVLLVIRDLIMVLMAGLIIGLALAFGVTRWLQSFLFGVTPHDPLAFLVSVTLIPAIALFAGYLPARRAANIDPMQALRHE